jgi:predicted transcriptional regulator
MTQPQKRKRSQHAAYPMTQESIDRGMADLAAGRVQTFDTVDALLDDLQPRRPKRKRKPKPVTP